MDPFAFALLCIPIGAGVLAVLFLLKIAAEPNSRGADTDCSVPKGPFNAHDLYSVLQAIQDSAVVTKDDSDEVTSAGTSTRPVSFDYSDTDLSASVGVSPPSYETLMETMSPIALSEESAAVDQKLEKILSYSDGLGHQSLVEPHIMSASTPETPNSEVAVLPYLDSASVLAHSRGLLAAVHGKPKLPEMDPKSTSTRLIPVDSLSDMGDSASSSPVTSPAFLLPMQGEDQIFDQDVPVTAGEGFIPNDSDDDSDDEFVYTGVDYKPDVAVEAPVTKANASDGNEGGVKPVVDLDSDDDDDFIYTGVDS